MKNVIVLFLLISLTGCVTYYYPETALEDGVYYAEDDPAYVLNSGDYSGVVYYPWSSLDYFYMGYWPYPGYGFSTATAYSIWLGYSPWNYSSGYYGYYPPRYFPRHYHAYGRYSGHRYAMNGPVYRGNRDADAADNFEYARERDGNDEAINSSSVRRYVTAAQPGYAGNQGMVVRRRHDSKIGNSRVEPVKSVNTKPVSTRPSTTGVFSRQSTTSLNSRRSRSHAVRAPSRGPAYGKSRTPSSRDRD